MRKKCFLHLGYDNKFYSGSIKSYNNIDGITNRFFVYKEKPKGPLKYLKGYESLITCCEKTQLINEIRMGDYDVFIIHSLSFHCWDIFKGIPKDKIVVWQSYGFDIYSPGPFGIDYKLIQIDSLLPITKKVFKESRTLLLSIKYYFAYIILNFRWRRLGRKIVERVNYFQPVFHLEYELLSKLPYFKAKEYYPPQFNPRWGDFSEEPKQDRMGAIQLCNSAGEYGNHLDVWEIVKKFISTQQEVIIPLSYGDKGYASYVRTIVKDDHDKTTILEDFIPREDYFEMMNRSTYFVHGALRQHAMANVYNAIAAGRKVFLFKSSLIYRHLTDIGCLVFPIEEINSKSFQTPLTVEEHNRNIDALKNMIKQRQDNRSFQELN